MSDRLTCPHCGSDQRDGQIPQEAVDLGYYGPPTTEPQYYFRTIGMEIRGVYDGILFWICPDCTGTWNRWPADHFLHAVVEEWMKKMAEERAEEDVA